MKFLWELITKLVQIFSVYGGMSYTSYIKLVLSCDFQITSENGNMYGGGRILKENGLLLQFTSISSYTIDANHQTYMHDTPMHTDGGNLFEIFLHLPVFKKFRF